MQTPSNTSRRKTPLQALRDYLTESAQSCRANRWFRPWFKFTVAEELALDVAQAEAKVAQDAYAAEQCDCEAERELIAACYELKRATEDGLTNSDMPRLVKAIQRVQIARKHVKRSAQLDRNIHELLPA